MIDLHSHTDRSDGTSTPAELIAEAVRVGLTGLAITDHDTFAGYDVAAPVASKAGLELICGIELSTRYQGGSVHLLGYFPHTPPSPEFRAWLDSILEARRDRLRRRQYLGRGDSGTFQGPAENQGDLPFRAGLNQPVGNPHRRAVLDLHGVGQKAEVRLVHPQHVLHSLAGHPDLLADDFLTGL